MYLHTGDVDGLGQPPRIPNPNLQQHCPILRDLHGRYVAWNDYVDRTRTASDAISKSLAELNEQQFHNENDFDNYVDRCKQASQPPQLPTLQPQPLPPE